tara:strand:+ start:2994 stop:3647 length:654 start_codon:yes stop_codon:yes gene_type:complete
MKVAVLLSGHAREWRSCWNSLNQNLIEPNNADVFIHSYESDDSKELVEILRPKKFVFEKQNEVEVNESLYNINMPDNLKYIINPISSVYMFRKIKLCFDLLEENYDAVIKTRFDCKYTEILNVKELDIDSYTIPTGGDYENGIFDMFCVSSYDNMKHYCGLYENIVSYLHKEIPLHSEILLKHHLTGRKINRVDYNIILRKVFDNSWPEDKVFNVRW